VCTPLLKPEAPMPKREKVEKPIEPKLGRRSAEHSGPTRAELAKIALELFAERHFASVSIRDIGRAAKVNSSMIYYHFKDKEHLFRAAIDTAIEEAFQLFDVHVALSKQLRNVVKIGLDCKGVIGVAEAEEPIKRFYRHESEIIQRYIREGTSQGLFRKVDAPVVATMISTILDGVMARSFILPDFEMVKTVGEFKEALWQYLGYHGPRTRRQRSPRKAKARLSL
jgi:AcrR family transcriptional regulator